MSKKDECEVCKPLSELGVTVDKIQRANASIKRLTEIKIKQWEDYQKKIGKGGTDERNA